MQDPPTARSSTSRGPRWILIWLGCTVVLALVLAAEHLPGNQVVAFTSFGSLLGGLIALTLKISNEQRRRDDDD